MTKSIKEIIKKELRKKESTNIDYLNFRLFSTTNWAGKGKSLAKFLRLQDSFVFEKWDCNEPIKKSFLSDEKEFVVAWDTEKWILLDSKSSKLWISIKWNPKAHIINRISGDIQISKNEPETIEKVLEFINGLITWGEVDYGYACLESELNQKDYLEHPTKINGKLIATAGMNPLEYLPGIYWFNFFGEKIIKEWKTKDLDRMPCYKKSNNTKGITILTYPSPYDFQDDENQSMSKSIVSYLESEYFFDKSDPQRVSTSILSY